MTAVASSSQVKVGALQVAARPASGASEVSKLLQTSLQLMNRRPPSLAQSHAPSLADTHTLTDRLFSSSAQLKVRISQVSMHLPDAWRKQIFRKLDYLYEPENWDASDALIKVESFVVFLRFILGIGPLARMSFGVSASGNLLVGWMKDKDSLNLEFLPGDEVRWNLVRHIDGRRESATGRTPIERLPAVLRPYDPEKWWNGQPSSSRG